jgi:NADPH-dependent ferric siderophore reductase
MAETAPRTERGRAPRLVHVEAIETLSAGLIRVVVSGPGLEGFAAGQFTDHYVKLQFPPPGAPYGPPFDPAEVRASLPSDMWFRTRTYTVREWDPEGRRLTLDFVVHGDEGVAGPWVLRAKVGDPLQLVGPGGAYAPDPSVEWHLLVGDESALPAIAVALERIPVSRRAEVVLQVPGPDHEIPLESRADLRVRWLHGESAEQVLDAVTGLTVPEGETWQAFVHGEAAMVRGVRRHLLVDRGLPREMLSASGYWKRDRTDEQWREDKPEWNRLAEADVS